VTATLDLIIEQNAPIPTWYRVGGGARRLARPRSAADIRRCLEIDPNLRVLGDGANLLVADEGVDELVIGLTDKAMQAVRFEDGPRGPGTRVVAMAGASLSKLVTETVRRGLEGLEGLGGIPASIGGAAIMNAGGTFGQIADVIARVRTIDRRGRERTLERAQIDYSYRHSGLSGVVITSVELDLAPGDPAALRIRLKDVMAYKKNSQPMAANSAGCCFRNPGVRRDVAVAAGWTRDDSGDPADLVRVSAGMLIDRAGCKGLRIGTAQVSENHANFLLADTGGRAGDVIALMAECTRRVQNAFGVKIEPEVVVWGHGPAI
jgi:UDP-N-acetylmuramate dehydrogenase